MPIFIVRLILVWRIGINTSSPSDASRFELLWQDRPPVINPLGTFHLRGAGGLLVDQAGMAQEKLRDGRLLDVLGPLERLIKKGVEYCRWIQAFDLVE